MEYYIDKIKKLLKLPKVVIAINNEVLAVKIYNLVFMNEDNKFYKEVFNAIKDDMNIISVDNDFIKEMEWNKLD